MVWKAALTIGRLCGGFAFVVYICAMATSHVSPLQLLVIASASLVLSPLILVLSPVLVPCGLIWVLLRRSSSAAQSSSTKGDQAPQGTQQVFQ